MYVIKKKCFYFGHLYKKDTTLLNDGHNVLKFETLDKAIKHLESMGVDDKITPQKYTMSGIYVTQWGEYDRPQYIIRKVKK